MPYNNSSLDKSDRQALLSIAWDSIKHGLEHRSPLPVTPEHYSDPLQQTTATFVTLQIAGQLRGCIGTLEAQTTLVQDVAEHAYAAAFNDPRFAPLSEKEFPLLEIHISLLTPAEPIAVNSQEELLEKLQPGVDGLILEENTHKATFLPSVWEQLPSPQLFLQHLKEKAGLPRNYWSDTLRFQRYQVVSIK